jgi:hypothetical protein
MFNFNAKFFKKIEEEKNNHMQMFQELKEELDVIKKDFKLFDDKISKLKANDYVKSPEIVNIIRSEIFEASKRLPKIRDTSVNKPVPTENTDKYKNLPTFLTCLEFAKVLNITGVQFFNRKKKIDQKVRCYNFGKRSPRYYKRDVLKFIKHQNTEDDIFILLKNSKDNRISKKDLISLLSISLKVFYANKKRIEKIIPPITMSKNLVFYKKTDVLAFLKKGGLDAH